MHLVQDSSGARISRDTDAFATRTMAAAAYVTIINRRINCSTLVSYFSTRELWRQVKYYLHLAVPALLGAKELH